MPLRLESNWDNQSQNKLPSLPGTKSHEKGTINHLMQQLAVFCINKFLHPQYRFSEQGWKQFHGKLHNFSNMWTLQEIASSLFTFIHSAADFNCWIPNLITLASYPPKHLPHCLEPAKSIHPGVILLLVQKRYLPLSFLFFSWEFAC